MTFEIDGFTPIDIIGRGGFGTVHRAADDAHGRQVAVKILGRITDDSARRRFDRERRAMGTLSGHPTIGIVYTSGFTKNQEPYIVMEMIRGGSLADRLEADGPLAAADVIELGATLAEALHHAHAGGVLHLDLKPENILMSRFGMPKIVDFGIAALVNDESSTSTIRATPAYADPEVLSGHPGTEQSDVYGLAATLFTLLDGAAPYSHGPSGLYQVMNRVALDPVPTIERDDVSRDLAALLHRAMAKTAVDRPQSMEEFATLLRQIDAEPGTRRRTRPARHVDRSTTPAEPIIAITPDVTPGSPSKLSAPHASDGWPAALGERPRLPGDAPASTPVTAPRPTPTPNPATSTPYPARSRPVQPAQPSAAAVAPQAVAHRSGDWPRTAVAPEPTAPSVRGAVVVLSSLAVLLAALLAFLVIQRNGDDRTTGDDGTTGGERRSGSGSTIDNDAPTTTAVLDEFVTDAGIVPDVAGLKTADAEEVIAMSGFRVSIPAHCFDSVAKQSPAAGARVAPDTIIGLDFAPCIVPDFVGLRIPEAARIVDEDFVVGLFIRWPAHCDDLVLNQDIGAGTLVDPGTTVNLTLAQEC